jgi:hypothetical protein
MEGINGMIHGKNDVFMGHRLKKMDCVSGCRKRSSCQIFLLHKPALTVDKSKNCVRVWISFPYPQGVDI